MAFKNSTKIEYLHFLINTHVDIRVTKLRDNWKDKYFNINHAFIIYE